MSGTVASRVSPKRLLFIAVLALAASAALVSSASGGGIRDWEPCPDNSADVSQDLICPDGTIGVPYTIKFRAVEEPPCSPGDDFWHISNDAPPPGLTLASDGTLSGTPTQAGTYAFWVEMLLPSTATCNSADTTQERFIIKINPGTPVAPPLAIGVATLGPSTVGTSFSLAMTATLPDPKTWSISAGTLPPGLAINVATGLISGTPTTAGTYTFTVRAQIDAARIATQDVTLTVREALTITGLDEPLLEVGVPYKAALKAGGGLRTYKWTLTAGEMPPGMTFWPGGAITGKPTTGGDYDITVTLTDSEGRTATYEDTFAVAERLAVTTTRLKGKVGRVLNKQVRTSGGHEPYAMVLRKGPLPRGVRFDRATGSFVGTPTKPGTWIALVEVVDALKVKAKATIAITIAPGRRA
jgi:large repetitive protein